MADLLASQSQRLRLHRLSAVGQRLLHRGAADRSVTVRRNDVFLVSYPRSGNTWLRFIISNLVDPLTPVDFVTLEHRAPDIHINSDRAMQRLSDPRFLKSHEYFDHRYRRVLYVVRDPRDIVSSYYRYHINYGHLPDGYSGSLYLKQFLDGKLDRCGTWLEHVGSWLGARNGEPSFRLLQYDEMLRDPAKLARELCDFLDLERSDVEITTAVSNSNRDRMRELERTQRTRSPILRGGRGNIPFVGKGTAASPVDDNEVYLRSEAARHAIEERFGRLMTELGYL